MGIKAIVDHYKIEHITYRDGDIVNIGSPYIHDIISIDIVKKEIVKSYLKSNRWSDNKDLMRYETEIANNIDRFVSLFEQEDVYENELISVYKFEDGKIVEQKAEKYNWPNLTIDGEIQYENTHFLTPKEALEKAKNINKIIIENQITLIQRLEKEREEAVLYKAKKDEEAIVIDKLLSDMP